MSEITLNRPICITGCGKSGTHFIAEALARGGLKIGHERNSPNGLASWYIAISATEIKIPLCVKNYVILDELKNPVILHQVRSPLSAISTAQVISGMSWSLVVCLPEIDQEDSILLRCMKYWRYWNLMAEKAAEWTYRVEDLGDMWKEFCSRISCPELLSKKSVCLDVRVIDKQRHRYTPFTWADLEEEDGKLCSDIIKQARRYGYNI